MERDQPYLTHVLKKLTLPCSICGLPLRVYRLHEDGPPDIMKCGADCHKIIAIGGTSNFVILRKLYRWNNGWRLSQ